MSNREAKKNAQKSGKVNPFGNVWVRYRQALVHNG